MLYQIFTTISILLVTVHLIARFLSQRKGANGFGRFTSGDEIVKDIDLSGKVVIVTGSNTGIGKETAISLVKRGAHVIMATRDEKKSLAAKKEIEELKKGQITYIPLDLGDLRSVEKFVKEFEALNLPLNILINNAGVMATPKQTTKDGFEYQFGINHLGHFKLTILLLPIMKKSGGGRIVNLSSSAHRMASKINFDDIYSEKSYSAWTVYGQSKIANIMFSNYLNKLLKKDNIPIIVNSLHPGGIMTDLQRDLGFITYYGISFLLSFACIGKTTQQGCSTTLYCAVHPSVTDGGQYYEDCNVSKANAYTDNEEEQKKLWDFSEKETKIKYPF